MWCSDTIILVKHMTKGYNLNFPYDKQIFIRSNDTTILQSQQTFQVRCQAMEASMIHQL